MELKAISGGCRLWQTSKKNRRLVLADAFNRKENPVVKYHKIPLLRVVNFDCTSSAVIQQAGRVRFFSVPHGKQAYKSYINLRN